MKTEITKGVEKGVIEQKRQFKRQEGELNKTKNKMKQLENSLNVSAKKYEQTEPAKVATVANISAVL